MDLDILNSWLTQNNLPKYRFSQISKNYFSAKYLKFDEMTDLPKTLRTQLDQNIKLLSVKEENLISSPHTQKALLRRLVNRLYFQSSWLSTGLYFLCHRKNGI
ncbi:MAG: putative dual-specificity RNA methyltransferase RlmN [Candidatus Shapirobacteria bacterium GW2011_GWE2_38_30]|uniref:Putative dual-specificity RNA methyltransferase RlmN n=1 Tax=Candidatus Shapirobacteria bacterium GW2011_GWE2_38_30 TaxID=1618490 RepID=A0A0G0MXR8_9BACT|nr:MAG: putative dual-specificity RNA methyltransferase RlmN [Candidatus Shapirobacteria bacterium GW2011_GWE2_38_30]